MDKDINLKILNELHKGAKMGMDSISYVSEKVSDENFKDNLMFQYNQYNDIVNQTNSIFQKYGEVPSNENTMTNIMSWTGIQMNTLTDKSNSHIADLLIQGTTMGIIEGRKILNNNPHADKQILTTLNNFVKMQENSVEKLKTFL